MPRSVLARARTPLIGPLGRGPYFAALDGGPILGRIGRDLPTGRQALWVELTGTDIGVFLLKARAGFSFCF